VKQRSSFKEFSMSEATGGANYNTLAGEKKY